MILPFFTLFLCLFLFSLPCVIPYVHPNPAIHRLATNVNEALFCTGVTTLLRDPWGGLSLVPLITSMLCLFCVDNLIAGVRKHGKHFTGILLSKSISNINKQRSRGNRMQHSKTQHIHIYLSGD